MSHHKIAESPPGFKGTVKAMKRHKEIYNPYALAWHLKNKGAKSHRKADGTKKMAAVLTAKSRKRISEGNFALPGRRYPIHDRAHGAAALSYVSRYGSAAEKATVRAKVYARYPDMGKAKKKKEAQLHGFLMELDHIYTGIRERDGHQVKEAYNVYSKAMGSLQDGPQSRGRIPSSAYPSSKLGVQDSSKSEFEKEAGIGSKLKALLTGRRTLFHGTSPARAESIRKSGLRPQAKSGITEQMTAPDEYKKRLIEANKGLVFTTKNKSTARTYAGQQRYLDAAKDPTSITSRVKKRFREAMERKGIPSEAQENISRVLGGSLHTIRPSTSKGVVKASIPIRKLKKKLTTNPEVEFIRERIRERGLPGATMDSFGEEIAKIQTSPFKSDQVIRGKLKKKYIQGSPDYKGVGLKELRRHFKRTWNNPRRTLREAWES